MAARHTVDGLAVLPSSVLVELAVRAGDELGCTVLEELETGPPLVLPERAGLQVQVRVGSERPGGRAVTVHARPDGSDAPWTRYAHGRLGAEPLGPGDGPAPWPPAGTERVDPADARALLAPGDGWYGPVFQEVSAVWRGNDAVYAEAALPAATAAQAAEYLLHPALLDAAVHAGHAVVHGGAEGVPQTVTRWRGCGSWRAGRPPCGHGWPWLVTARCPWR